MCCSNLNVHTPFTFGPSTLSRHGCIPRIPTSRVAKTLLCFLSEGLTYALLLAGMSACSLLASVSFAVAQMCPWTPSDSEIVKADKARRRATSSTAGVESRTSSSSHVGRERSANGYSAKNGAAGALSKTPDSSCLGAKRSPSIPDAKNGVSLPGTRPAGEWTSRHAALPFAEGGGGIGAPGPSVFRLALTIGPKTSGRDILNRLNPVTTDEQRKQLKDAIMKANVVQVSIEVVWRGDIW